MLFTRTRAEHPFSHSLDVLSPFRLLATSARRGVVRQSICPPIRLRVRDPSFALSVLDSLLAANVAITLHRLSQRTAAVSAERQQCDRAGGRLLLERETTSGYNDQRLEQSLRSPRVKAPF
jgi:hypothetical protein